MSDTLTAHVDQAELCDALRHVEGCARALIAANARVATVQRRVDASDVRHERRFQDDLRFHNVAGGADGLASWCAFLKTNYGLHW